MNIPEENFNDNEIVCTEETMLDPTSFCYVNMTEYSDTGFQNEYIEGIFHASQNVMIKHCQFQNFYATGIGSSSFFSSFF